MGRQQDFRTDHTFFGVVAVLAVVFTMQLFTKVIDGRHNSGLPCVLFNLGNMKVK